MRTFINILLIGLFAIIMIIACDDTQIADADLPDEDLSYEQHIQPILTLKCARSGCHDSETEAAGYGTYDWISTNTSPYVMEYDADNSLAYMAMAGKGGLSLMPPLDSPVYLTDKQIEAFKTWIDEGAKNN